MSTSDIWKCLVYSTLYVLTPVFCMNITFWPQDRAASERY